MPLYEYSCRKCDKTFEAVRTIGKRYLVTCPNCRSPDISIMPSGGRQKVILFPAGIWNDIAPEPLEINNRRELREACRKNKCYAKYDDGILGV